MIGRLKGLLEDKGDSWVLVDVNGVGYLVEVSSRLLGNLPAIGEPVVLSVETYVREDQLRLFGFADENEKSLFKLLMGVQGVGAKVALAIQGVLSGDELAQAIAAQDKAMVARAPGVGPKVAQRIVQELKDKMPETSFAGVAAFAEAEDGAGKAGIADALSALENLGYARAQAHQAVMGALQQAGDAEPKTEDLIRLALKELGR
ncbi:MAG: Holliday junction branch migration protein RuvA [Parvibaculales bacterium]